MILAATLLGGVLSGSSQVVTAPSDSGDLAYLPEVRLRKLHLVRPDLIHYPLHYAVFC